METGLGAGWIMSDFQAHYEDEAWIDFVRGLLPGDEAESMQAHLQTGCAQCREAHTTWSRVWDISRREQTYEAPQPAVRAAKAAFALRRRIPMLSRIAQAAQQVFDSFREPLPAGIRGGAAPPRYLVYRSEDLLVDLQIESRGARQYSLTGQVMDTATGTASAGAGIVLVEGEDQVVGQAIANSFGEFQLEFGKSRDLKLYLETVSATSLAMALPDPGEVQT